MASDPLQGDVREAAQALSHRVLWLRANWVLFEQLFGSSSGGPDLLNQCASTFFYVCERALVRQVLLMIEQLTGNHITDAGAGTDAVSLVGLVHRLTGTRTPELRNPHLAALNEVNARATAIELLWDRDLAAIDLRTPPAASPLPAHLERQIEGCIREIERVLGEVLASADLRLEFCPGIDLPGDGQALLAALEGGRKA